MADLYCQNIAKGASKMEKADKNNNPKIELIEAIGGTIPLYVRYNVGCKIFGMSQREFEILADRAGAIHKVGKMNLVNTVIFNDFLQPYRLPPESKSRM